MHQQGKSQKDSRIALTFVDDVEVREIVLVSTNNSINVVLQDLLEPGGVPDASYPSWSLRREILAAV